MESSPKAPGNEVEPHNGPASLEQELREAANAEDTHLRTEAFLLDAWAYAQSIVDTAVSYTHLTLPTNREV